MINCSLYWKKKLKEQKKEKHTEKKQEIRTSSLEIDDSMLEMRQPMKGRTEETGEYVRYNEHQKREHVSHKGHLWQKI